MCFFARSSPSTHGSFSSLSSTMVWGDLAASAGFGLPLMSLKRLRASTLVSKLSVVRATELRKSTALSETPLDWMGGERRAREMRTACSRKSLRVEVFAESAIAAVHSRSAMSVERRSLAEAAISRRVSVLE